MRRPWLYALGLLLPVLVAALPPDSHRIAAVTSPIGGFGLRSNPFTIPSTAVGGLIRVVSGVLTTAATAQSGLVTWPANTIGITVPLTTAAVDATYGVFVLPKTAGFASTGAYSATQRTTSFDLANAVTPTTTQTLFWTMQDR
ncbi:MAG: hypothetical protein AABY75_05390 [Bacteroidota bacterium]